MRLKILLATVVVALCLPGSAQAVQLVNPDGSVAQPYQAWADAAKVPMPDRVVNVEPSLSRCGVGHRACTWADQLRIACVSGRDCRFVLLHEIGHQYDFAMPVWKRQVFARIVGHWDAERFAVGYSLCALGVREYRSRQADGSVRTDYGYGYHPTRSQQRRVCRLIRQPN